ncbi:hypothetical protein [Rhizobium sp. R339]|uniref:hypothetical protein n=1 Tax=Rhizobium sp. R339 TaxID=1764273 RepID=UPI001AECD8B1|nr:hypothetical protein [Rhizobium sp. R339]
MSRLRNTEARNTALLAASSKWYMRGFRKIYSLLQGSTAQAGFGSWRVKMTSWRERPCSRVNMSRIEKLLYPARVAVWRTKSSLGRGASAWPMTVEVSHHVDAYEPDAEGFYHYHYEYAIFKFTDGVMTLLARAYSDEPRRAALMAWNEGINSRLLRKRDLRHPLFLGAMAYLERAGKSELDWLDRNSGSYLPIVDRGE